MAGYIPRWFTIWANSAWPSLCGQAHSTSDGWRVVNRNTTQRINPHPPSHSVNWYRWGNGDHRCPMDSCK